MELQELKKLNKEELKQLLGEERGNLRRMKFELYQGKVKNVHSMRLTKKRIAQISTLLQHYA